MSAIRLSGGRTSFRSATLHVLVNVIFDPQLEDLLNEDLLSLAIASLNYNAHHRTRRSRFLSKWPRFHSRPYELGVHGPMPPDSKLPSAFSTLSNSEHSASSVHTHRSHHGLPKPVPNYHPGNSLFQQAPFYFRNPAAVSTLPLHRGSRGSYQPCEGGSRGDGGIAAVSPPALIGLTGSVVYFESA